MLNDASVAKYLIGLSITLVFIGVVLWKLVYFEIKGENHITVNKREKITQWIGENLVIFALLSTILALLYKYITWFNMIKTGMLYFLLGTAVVFRICSIEEIYEQRKVGERENAKG